MCERDRKQWRLTAVDPQDEVWWSALRLARCAASQLPGRGPTDVDNAPSSAQYYKMTSYDDDDDKTNSHYNHSD